MMMVGNNMSCQQPRKLALNGHDKRDYRRLYSFVMVPLQGNLGKNNKCISCEGRIKGYEYNKNKQTVQYSCRKRVTSGRP